MSSIALADRLDQAIKVLIASSNGDLPTTNPKISGLRRIAAELRSLPSPDFKADLKAQLLEHALGGPCGAPCFPSSGGSRNRPCPLFSGAGRSGCPVQGSNLVLSFLAHAAGVAFLLSSGLWMAQHKLIHQEMVVSRRRRCLSLADHTSAAAWLRIRERATCRTCRSAAR